MIKYHDVWWVGLQILSLKVGHLNCYFTMPAVPWVLVVSATPLRVTGSCSWLKYRVGKVSSILSFPTFYPTN